MKYGYRPRETCLDGNVAVLNPHRPTRDGAAVPVAYIQSQNSRRRICSCIVTRASFLSDFRWKLFSAQMRIAMRVRSHLFPTKSSSAGFDKDGEREDGW